MSNVSSVDLDELRKAREELNKEIGVENDPDMYKDYNPNREEEPKKTESSETTETQNVSEVAESSENIEENTTSETSDANFSNDESADELPSKKEVLDLLLDDDAEPSLNEEEKSDSIGEESIETPSASETESHSSSEANLGKFDMFAAFEVKENAVPKTSSSELEKIISDETTTERTTNLEKLEKELEADNLGEKVEEFVEPVETTESAKFETIDNLDELENMLSGLLDSLDFDDGVLENTNVNQEESSSSENEMSLLSKFDVEPNLVEEETETNELENLESALLSNESDEEDNEPNPLDEEPEPVRKDVLSALMNRNSSSEELAENSSESSEETDYSEMNFNLDNFEINVDSNLQTAINEPDEMEQFGSNEEKVEEPVSLAGFDIEPNFGEVEESSETSKTEESAEAEVQEDSQETEENEDIEESETNDSAETNIENEEISDENIEENKEESLDVGIKDIGRILGINEEKPEKEEFVETTEYYDPSKSRTSNKSRFENKSSDEPEIITDYNQLREILQRELKESELAEQEKIEEEIEKEEDDGVKYAVIDEFKFINEITTDEFKSSNKFSYIMGKNESGEMIYGNFREHHNLAVFGKNETITKSFLNSLILSLCLKNGNHDVNFVLIDSDINSSFEVYNKSSYLFFNRIAKTNKEILDTLIEVTKELDARYEKLAGSGMGSVDQFNDMAKETQTTPMPNLIVVFNNYTDVSQATYSDKINACLYQILKFGRIVGIYMVLTAMRPIETNEVNYNLSSRLSFKSDHNSKYTVGVEGVEKLPDEADAIYFNISKNSTEHIKTATVTDSELDLIIKELED